MENSAQNHHSNCKPKIVAHNQTQIAKEEEERRQRREREREVMFGVCDKVGRAMGR